MRLTLPASVYIKLTPTIWTRYSKLVEFVLLFLALHDNVPVIPELYGKNWRDYIWAGKRSEKTDL